jgi:hypothetical protein
MLWEADQEGKESGEVPATVTDGEIDLTDAPEGQQ